MSANEMVLGLLIERPDNSYQLDRRLEEEFPSAQFTRGTARQALRRLATKDLVRPVDGQDRGTVESSGVAPGTAYEVTTKGVAFFRAWIGSSISLPTTREDLLAKTVLCTPGDLPRMIEVAREAELSCTIKLRAMNRRTHRERERAEPRAWKMIMGMTARAAEAGWWESRITWLQKLRADLEIELRRQQAEQGSARPSPGGR